MNAAGSGNVRFDFATAGRIVFGVGSAAGAADAIRSIGRRPLVVSGSRTSRAQWLLDALSAAGATCQCVSVTGEPDVAFVHAAAAGARAAGCDVVIGVGGGSALDAAKAVAALAPNDGDVLDYLEVVGRGLALGAAPLSVVAIPTTSGTGSEVTRNAVLAVPESQVKASLRSPLMLPRLAIVDPDLTLDLPPAQTAHTGLDALTQLIEPFLSHKATALTDALCREAIPRVARALPRAVADGHDREARADMSLGSLFGGLALANAGLGAVHGFAAPIGGRFQAPHGAVCAALLAPVFAANLQAVRQRAPGSAAAARMDEVGRLLTGRPSATADDAHRWLAETTAALGIQGLSAFGVAEANVDALAAAAAQSSSMKANPIVLTDEELRAALKAAR